jgi:hypothetical protein
VIQPYHIVFGQLGTAKDRTFLRSNFNKELNLQLKTRCLIEIRDKLYWNSTLFTLALIIDGNTEKKFLFLI